MYGLFEAAHQMREHGRLRDTTASPALAVRAVRLNRADLPTGDDLRSLLALLASSRFNTLLIVPEPPRDLSPTLAAQFGLKLALTPIQPDSSTVELPVASTAIPWADPGPVSRLLAWTPTSEGFHGFVIPRTPALRAPQCPSTPSEGLRIGHGAEDSSPSDGHLCSATASSLIRPAPPGPPSHWPRAASPSSRPSASCSPRRNHRPARHRPLHASAVSHRLISGLARDAEDAQLPSKPNSPPCSP
ncbi:MAG: hypothetical protein IPJ98_02255 [Bryobacterales bacterium]|nr:hypothetical protein [Bryobacterales bacterium]